MHRWDMSTSRRYEFTFARSEARSSVSIVKTIAEPLRDNARRSPLSESLEMSGDRAE
jgi:hypothetical protein